MMYFQLNIHEWVAFNEMLSDIENYKVLDDDQKELLKRFRHLPDQKEKA